MSKFDFIKDKNIVPVHKILTLEYETEYSGNTEQIDIRIYPYTLAEKLAFKNKNDEASKLRESKKEEDVKRANDLIQEATYEAVFAVLKKDDPTTTLTHVKKLPETWLDKIIFKALEFEGIDEEKIREQTQKKELNTL
jgi:hypothetical protein